MEIQEIQKELHFIEDVNDHEEMRILIACKFVLNVLNEDASHLKDIEIVCRHVWGYLQTNRETELNNDKYVKLIEAYFYVLQCKDDLNTEFIKTIHAILSNDSDEFRSVDISIYRCMIRYTNYKNIENELEQLFLQLNTGLNACLNYLDFIKVAAAFFVTFSRIHPFYNHNYAIVRLALLVIAKKASAQSSVIIPYMFEFSKYQDILERFCLRKKGIENEIVSIFVKNTLHFAKELRFVYL